MNARTWCMIDAKIIHLFIASEQVAFLFVNHQFLDELIILCDVQMVASWCFAGPRWDFIVVSHICRTANLIHQIRRKWCAPLACVHALESKTKRRRFILSSSIVFIFVWTGFFRYVSQFSFELIKIEWFNLKHQTNMLQPNSNWFAVFFYCLWIKSKHLRDSCGINTQQKKNSVRIDWNWLIVSVREPTKKNNNNENTHRHEHGNVCVCECVPTNCQKVRNFDYHPFRSVRAFVRAALSLYLCVYVCVVQMERLRVQRISYFVYVERNRKILQCN